MIGADHVPDVSRDVNQSQYHSANHQVSSGGSSGSFSFQNQLHVDLSGDAQGGNLIAAEQQQPDIRGKAPSPRSLTVQQHLSGVADAATSHLARVLPQNPQLPLPQPLARVYHSLWRGPAESVSSSTARGSVGELLVGSGSDSGDTESRRHVTQPLRHHLAAGGSSSLPGSSLHINISRPGSTAGFSRPASIRALNELDHQAAQQKWEALRPHLVAWLCASLITILLSWWWFALGCLVGAIGAVGALSALRHKAGVDLIRPAKGAQFLGVIAGLVSAAATLVVIVALASVRCKYVMTGDCARLRIMLCFLVIWFIIMMALSASAAFRAYYLIQLLSPTFYWRQSEVAVPEEEEGGRVLLRQETFTPRAAAQMAVTLDDV